MPFVTFTVSKITEEARPKHFEQGKTYELSADSCRRWKLRDVARDATAEEIAALKPVKAPKVEEKPAPAPEPVVEVPAVEDPAVEEQTDRFDDMDRAELFAFIEKNDGKVFKGAGTDTLRRKARELAAADDAE